MILLGTTAWVISRPGATAKLAWSSVAMDLPGLFPSVQLSKPSSWTCRIATELSLELHSPARTPWWYSMILDDTRYSMIGMIWQLRCMIKDASKPDIWANACLMPAGQQRASPVIVATEYFYPRRWQDATHLVVHVQDVQKKAAKRAQRQKQKLAASLCNSYVIIPIYHSYKQAQPSLPAALAIYTDFHQSGSVVSGVPRPLEDGDAWCFTQVASLLVP